MYNVWIVDDEPLILEGLASLVDWPSLGLELAGKAENGLDALEQIEAGRARVDILITDISMPEMDGLVLLKKLKQRNPELKGIILSGYNEFDYIKEGMRIGIENYLLKPVNLEELKQTLVHVIENLDRSRTPGPGLSQDQIELLKDNILYRWVMNRISREEWKLRAGFLQLQLKSPAAAAAIIRMPSKDDGPQSEEAFRIRKLAVGFMAETGREFLYFQNTDDDTVLLLGTGGTSGSDLSELGRLLRNLSEHLALAGLQPLIALGSLEAGFDRAPASYRNALSALEYALLLPDERLLIYEKAACPPHRPASPSVDCEAYARLLLAFDSAGLRKQIEDDLLAISKSEGITPSRLRHSVVEIVVQMKKMIQDVNPGHPVFQAYHDIVNLIFSARSLEELKKHVFSMTELVSELLKERQELSPVIRQIVKHIETSYMEEHSLKSLAQKYHVHPFYLGQLFQKELNLSFSDYLNRLRMEKAVEFMKNTPMKTQDIAEAVGYWDTAHFYKHFKKHFGVSPAQYRKLL